MQRLLGIEPAAQHQPVAERQRQHRLAQPGAVKHRRGQHRCFVAAPRNSVQQLRGEQGRGFATRCAFRGARRPAGQQRQTARLRRRRHGCGGSRSDQPLDGAVGWAVGCPGDESPYAPVDGAEELAEFVVVDQDGDVFASGDVGELGLGEPGVHQQQLCADLAGRGEGGEQSPVIAAQHRDDVARSDTPLGPRPRQRVDLTVEVGECQITGLIGDGERIGVVHRGRLDDPGEPTVGAHQFRRPDAVHDASGQAGVTQHAHAAGGGTEPAGGIDDVLHARHGRGDATPGSPESLADRDILSASAHHARRCKPHHNGFDGKGDRCGV